MNSQQERLRRPQGSPPVRVALLRMPNTGKSTLYNRLTGGHAQIANWPGLTVDLLQGPMAPNRNGRSYALVDLPGIHDLSGSSEDEAVAQRFLRFTPPDLLLVVINASQIGTQLRLLLQLQQLGLPLEPDRFPRWLPALVGLSTVGLRPGLHHGLHHGLCAARDGPDLAAYG